MAISRESPSLSRSITRMTKNYLKLTSIGFVMAMLFSRCAMNSIINDPQHFADFDYTKIDLAYTENEPSIAISKKDTNIVVAATNLNKIYYTHDDGIMWNAYELHSSLGFYGDPVLHAADNGDFYLVHLSKTPGKKWGDWFDRIVFQKSSDDGKSFTDGVGIGYNQDRTQDKPWINTDSKGNLYLTWTEFDKYGSDSAHHKSKIMFSMSSDEGDTWSDPIVISDEPGGCKDDDNTLEGATTAMDASGTIYVTWAGHEKIFMNTSTDGGKTFGKDWVIGEQKDGWVLDIPHFYRTNGMPFLQIDRSKGPGNEILYIVFTSKVGEQNKTMLLKSTDGGENWERLTHFQDKLDGNQFFPNLAVDPKDGTIVLGFYDAPKVFKNDFASYRFFKSTDQGKSFQEMFYRDEQFPLAPKSVFFGDYSDVDVTQGSIAAIATKFEASGLNKGYLHVKVFKDPDYSAHQPFQVAIREDHLGLILLPNSKTKAKLKFVAGPNAGEKKKYVYKRSNDSFGYVSVPIKKGSKADIIVKVPFWNGERASRPRYNLKYKNYVPPPKHE